MGKLQMCCLLQSCSLADSFSHPAVRENTDAVWLHEMDPKIATSWQDAQTLAGALHRRSVQGFAAAQCHGSLRRTPCLQADSSPHQTTAVGTFRDIQHTAQSESTIIITQQLVISLISELDLLDNPWMCLQIPFPILRSRMLFWTGRHMSRQGSLAESRMSGRS